MCITSVSAALATTRSGNTPESTDTLVSKDSDSHEMSLLRGCPPKVIWLKRGNCPAKHIAIILRNQAAQIEALSKDPEAVFLLLL